LFRDNSTFLSTNIARQNNATLNRKRSWNSIAVCVLQFDATFAWLMFFLQPHARYSATRRNKVDDDDDDDDMSVRP